MITRSASARSMFFMHCTVGALMLLTVVLLV